MQIVSTFSQHQYASRLLVQWHKSSIKIPAGFGDKLNWHHLLRYVEPCGVHHNKEQTSLRVAASEASFNSCVTCEGRRASMCTWGDSLPAESTTCLETARWYMTGCAAAWVVQKVKGPPLNVGSQELSFTCTQTVSKAPPGTFMPALCTCQMCFDAGS